MAKKCVITCVSRRNDRALTPEDRLELSLMMLDAIATVKGFTYRLAQEEEYKNAKDATQ